MHDRFDSNVLDWAESLAAARPKQAFNPWAEHDPLDSEADAPGQRLKRLLSHLSTADARLLLIGEAPSWRGCKWTGCAFSSEKLLFEGVIPRLEWQAQRRITARKLPFSEASATIVWRTLFELGIAETTLLWNAFPWHPYADDAYSNRTPTTEELRTGAAYLDGLLALFPGIKVVAVGNHARASLKKLGRQCEAVRHPSMGGAQQFRKGLSALAR